MTKKLNPNPTTPPREIAGRPYRLLRVIAPGHDGNPGGFVAGAVFEKVKGRWRVSHCAPILAWWHRVPVANIGNFLKGAGAKAGWQHEWVSSWVGGDPPRPKPDLDSRLVSGRIDPSKVKI